MPLVGVLGTFGLVSSLVPPFFSNQNTYLVHGAVMSGGYSRLVRDWFANTSDPTPLFSLLTAGILALGGPKGLVFANAVLGAGFLGALTLCGEKMSRSPATVASRTGLACALGSAWFVLPGSALFSGVADQYVYRGFLQPASFGVLLIWAAWAFSSLRSRFAVALGSAAVWMHPTYLLSFVSLLVAFASLATSWPWRRRLRLVLAGVLSTLPPTLWSMARFTPTSKSAFAAALDVLANHRLPHHTDPKTWICATVAAQLMVIAVGLRLARRESRLLLLGLALPGLALTLLAALLPQLVCVRLAFPWRFSAILVPISAALIFGRATRALLESRPAVAWLTFVLSVSVAGHSGYQSFTHHRAPQLELFAKAEIGFEREHGDHPTVLTPPEWEEVRLNAAVPIFVDYKSHPFKDTEVLDWWNRLTLARRFYDGSARHSCEALTDIVALDPTLGWVVTPGREDLSCRGVSPFATTRQGTLFRIERRL